MPAPSGYAYYRLLSDGNGTALAPFVCRVDLTSSNFDFGLALSSGADLRVYDVTGDATLPYWLQDYDATARTGRLFYLAANTGHTHRLYYGNASAASASTFANVFTKGTGFDSGWGDLTAQVSGAGAATRYPAWNGAPTDDRLFRVFTRSNTPQVATGYVANRPCVREFSILTDPTGKIVQDGGVYVAYHVAQNTSDSVTYPGQTYRVTSTDLVTWGSRTLALAANNPTNTHNDQGARVATAIKMGAGDYRMWYTSNGTVTSGVGYATSTDGITFTDQGLVLTSATSGITDVSPFLSGVPDVIRLLDGTWIMHCEVRINGGAGFPWKVYGWTSPDVTSGGTWTVLNGGASLIAASNGLTTWGNANPHLWQRGASDFLIYCQAFSGSNTDLTTFNGNVGVWSATSKSGPYTYVNQTAGRINVAPSNFGTEAGGLAFASDGTPVWHIQDYPASDNLNTQSNVYRVYPVPARLGLFTTTAAADAAIASMTVAGGTFTAENRVGMGCVRSGDNTIYCLALSNGAAAIAPDTSTNLIANLCLVVRRNTYSSGQSTGSPSGAPGNVSLLYWDAGGTRHDWGGSSWLTTPADAAASDCLREIVARIDDDGTNYILSARYADDMSLVTSASVAKASVRATGSGRVLSAGVLFTNTNYGQAYSRQVSVRPYAATEPSISAGPLRAVTAGTTALLIGGMYLSTTSPLTGGLEGTHTATATAAYPDPFAATSTVAAAGPDPFAATSTIVTAGPDPFAATSRLKGS